MTSLRGIVLVVAAAAGWADCGRGPTLIVRPRPEASAGAVLLPMDVVVFKDGGGHDPAATVAGTRRALAVLGDAFEAEAARSGVDVRARLTWSGRLVSRSGRDLGAVADPAGVLEAMQRVLAGEGLGPDLAEALGARTGASVAVLVTGRATWISPAKMAGQVAAAIGITVLGIGVAGLVVAAAVGGELSIDVGTPPDVGHGRAPRGPVHGGLVVLAGPSSPRGIHMHPLPILGVRRLFEYPETVRDPAPWLPPEHVHGTDCAPAHGIHDGVLPLSALMPRPEFWRGSRVDLTVAFLSLADGAASWSAHAERRADVRRPTHAAALFRSLLGAAREP